MPLMNIVEGLEGRSDGDRRELVCHHLDRLDIAYQRSKYKGGTNIVVSSGREREIGVASHFDVFTGSPGANDNASAIAVCLDVLRKTQERPLKNIGVRGLFFDEEEVRRGFKGGTKGSKAYVKAGGMKGLIGVYNMELVGMGNKIALWCDEELHEGLLLRSIEDCARACGVECYRFPELSRFLSNSGDHRRFNEAGMKEAFCITAVSEEDVRVGLEYIQLAASGASLPDSREIESKLPLFRHYHRPSDRSEYLSEDSLRMVSDLLYSSVCEIDRRANQG